MRNKSLIISSLTLILLMIGLVLTIPQAQKRQETRKQATTTGGIGKLILDPQTLTKYPGQIFTTTARFHTGGASISALTFRLSYPYTGTTPELEIVDALGVTSNQIYPTANLLSTEKWVFPVKTVARANNLVTIEFAAVNTDTAGFSAPATTFIDLANIYFKVNRASATPITLTFDITETIMYTKSEPLQDILDDPLNVSYTLSADTVAPNAITNLDITNNYLHGLALGWTAPSDSGPEGKAASYDLRYSTSGPITETNWASATQAPGEPIPGNPGVVETMTIDNLLGNTIYYFAVKSTDAAGNVSIISSSNPFGATASPTLTFGFKIQSIPKASVEKLAVVVTLKNASTEKIYDNNVFVSNSNFVFLPRYPITLTDLPVDPSGTTYDVYVKEPTTLRKKLGSITITEVNNTGPTAWQNLVLKAGDFNNSNTITIQDINAILTVYTALSTPLNGSNNRFDVNNNGFIDIMDISPVLSNYTALTVFGD